MLKITSKSKNENLAWILKTNVLLVLNLWLTETGAVTQRVNNKARKLKYGRTSIKRLTFIWQPVAKILEKIVSYTL